MAKGILAQLVSLYNTLTRPDQPTADPAWRATGYTYHHGRTYDEQKAVEGRRRAMRRDIAKSRVADRWGG